MLRRLIVLLMPVATVFRYLKPEASPREDPGKFIEGARSFIREHVDPKDRVEIMVSGGADSTVTAALFHLEVGDRLYVTHVDTGFMRLLRGREESETIAEKFAAFKNFKLVNARPLFYEKVMGIPDAEEKRLGFRRAYEIATDQQMVESECNVMTQGTILPDIIETEGGVKSQHNVFLKFSRVEKVVEPVAGLCKDEIRKVASYLYAEYGLKALENASRRQPFPGPGLSVRTVGAITPEKLDVEKRANDIVEQAVDAYTHRQYGVNMYIDPKTGMQIPFQSFAATFDDRVVEAPANVKDTVEEEIGGRGAGYLLDVNATGVREGKRIYSRPLCLEVDFEPSYELLNRIGSDLPIRTGVSRVVYRVNAEAGSGKYVVAVRSVNSVDAMTATINPLPLQTLRAIAEEIVRSCNARMVYWDITPKPPATIEYE